MNFGGIIHVNKTGLCVLCVILLLLFFYVSTNKKELDINSKVNDLNQISLRKLVNVAIRAVENGGIEVVQRKDSIKIKKKGLTEEGVIDSVTTADFLSHCSMIKTLKHFYPSLLIISEEAKTICDDNQYVDFSLPSLVDENISDEFIDGKSVTIWIDPLDATKEYTEKLYNYVTVMACVAVDGKPLIGVIHKPFSKHTSWVWGNKTKSVDIYKQTYDKNKSSFKVIISRSHKGTIEEVLHKSFNKNIEVIVAAGAGYKALEVAKGNVDAYLHITAIKKWDICAGNAVINSLGGKMTTKYNEEIDYSSGSDVKNGNGVIASIGSHDMFLGKL